MPRPGRQFAWLAASAAVWFAVYLASAPRAFAYDTLTYAQAIESGAPPHPHHVAYFMVGRAAWRLVNIIQPVRAIYVMQWLDALAATLAGVCFVLLLRRWGAPRVPALLAAWLLAGSAAWWRYAVTGETYMLPVAAGLGGLLLAERSVTRRGLRRLAATTLAGSCFAAATALHQTHALFVAPLVVWCVLRRVRPQDAAALLGVFVGGAFVAYMAAHHAARGSLDVAAMIRWSLSYATNPDFAGAYGGPPDARNLPRTLEGLSRLVTAERWPLPLRLLVLEGLLLLSALDKTFRARAWRGGRRRLWWFLATWIAVHLAFSFWWEAGNVEFLVALLPPLIAWSVLAHRRLWLRRRDGRRLRWILAAYVLFAWAVNGPAMLSARHPGDYARTERLVAAHCPSGSVVIQGRDTLSMYPEYFAGVRVQRVFGLTWARHYASGPAEVHFARLAGEIERHLAAGRRVFTVEFPADADTEPAVHDALPVTDLSAADIRAFYQRFPRRCLTELAPGVWELLGPTADAGPG